MKDVEPLLERGQREKVKVDEQRLQQLVRGFATDWKKSIEVLNQDIMQSFTNFRNGTAILQVKKETGLVGELECVCMCEKEGGREKDGWTEGEGEGGRERGREREREREREM